MIFQDLQTNFKERLPRESQAGTFDTRIKRLLNNAIIYIANVENQGRWRQKYMWRKAITTTASQNYVMLPIDFDSLMNAWHEEYGNEELLDVKSLYAYRDFSKDVDTTGNPEYCAVAPSSGILAQPSSASVISMTSSEDDVTQYITIFGIVSNYPDSESVRLTGTSSVSTNKSFSRIDKVTKSASTVGRVTLTSNSGAVTNVVLPAGLLSNSVEYSLLYMHPYSSSAITLYIDYIRKQYWLTKNYDTHIMGDEFDEPILLYAEWLYSGNDKRIMQYKDMMQPLKAKYNFTPGARHEIGNDIHLIRGGSFNLGGNYPRMR